MTQSSSFVYAAAMQFKQHTYAEAMHVEQCLPCFDTSPLVIVPSQSGMDLHMWITSCDSHDMLGA